MLSNTPCISPPTLRQGTSIGPVLRSRKLHEPLFSRQQAEAERAFQLPIKSNANEKSRRGAVNSRAQAGIPRHTFVTQRNQRRTMVDPAFQEPARWTSNLASASYTPIHRRHPFRMGGSLGQDSPCFQFLRRTAGRVSCSPYRTLFFSLETSTS